jgi:hypothetical protein
VEEIVKVHRQRVKQEAEQAGVETARKDAAEKADGQHTRRRKRTRS